MNTTPPIDDREPTLAEHIAAVISSPAVAAAITEVVLEQLRARVGGRRVYVAATTVASAAEKLSRVEEIRQQFNGRNRKELCRQYRISRATFYRIIGQREIG